LNCRANHLAQVLRAHGVGPEVSVALCLERSLDMAVAVFGILKSGGVLLPVDAAQPSDRLSKMLEEGAADLILADKNKIGRLPVNPAAVLCAEEVCRQSSRDISTTQLETLTADNLCAIFFTSGSTGAPKGVLVSHRVASKILWTQAN